MNQAQMQQELFGQGIRSCVSCPFCKKTVSARFSATQRTIECLNKECGAKVNSSGKRIDQVKDKKNKSFADFVLEIFMSLS
jgi:molybdenum cofactor biosynthesis enzyme MoaA